MAEMVKMWWLWVRVYPHNMISSLLETLREFTDNDFPHSSHFSHFSISTIIFRCSLWRCFGVVDVIKLKNLNFISEFMLNHVFLEVASEIFINVVWKWRVFNFLSGNFLIRNEKNDLFGLKLKRKIRKLEKKLKLQGKRKQISSFYAAIQQNRHERKKASFLAVFMSLFTVWNNTKHTNRVLKAFKSDLEVSVSEGKNSILNFTHKNSLFHEFMMRLMKYLISQIFCN